VHRNLAIRCPLTKRVVVYAEILDRFCGVHLFRRFGHGHGLQKLRREFRKTGSLTNPTRFEQQDVIPGRFWPNAGNHGNSSRIIATERLRYSGFQGSMCVVAQTTFKSSNTWRQDDGQERQTQDQRRGRLRKRTTGRPRPGNANRRIAIRSPHKRFLRGGECAVPEPAWL
jgi:hypothetical protein